MEPMIMKKEEHKNFAELDAETRMEKKNEATREPPSVMSSGDLGSDARFGPAHNPIQSKTKEAKENRKDDFGLAAVDYEIKLDGPKRSSSSEGDG